MEKRVSFWNRVKKKYIIPHFRHTHTVTLNRKDIEGEVCLVLGGKLRTGNGPEAVHSQSRKRSDHRKGSDKALVFALDPPHTLSLDTERLTENK